MSRRIVAVLLAVLMALTAVLVLVPSQGHASPASTATLPSVRGSAEPSAAITYSILNGYGGAVTRFFPGEVGWGTLCFTVTDFLDRAVNVTLTDPNAVLDGVPTPAFHYVAVLNTTTFSYNSYETGVCYTFPAKLPYGGPWTVNFSAPNGGTVDQNVTVLVYYANMNTSVGSGATLPGAALTVFWVLLSEANGASLYTHATSVTLSATYDGNGTHQNLFPHGHISLTPPSAGQGQWSGNVPWNATPDSQVNFLLDAVTNVSGKVVENETATISVDVGYLAIQRVGLTVAPPTCSLFNSLYFATGALLGACVSAGADYFGSFWPIANLPVQVQYWDGSVHVFPAGAPMSLVTNASGEAAFTFFATSPPFIPYVQYPGDNAVNFTVSLPGASKLYSWTDWSNETFFLIGGSSSSGVVQVTLDHTAYYAGTVATATWSVSTTNLSQTGPVTPTGWYVTGPYGITYASGILNATMSSGTFSFNVTSTMVPKTITVAVLAANATEGFTGVTTARVLATSLLLAPSTGYYTAGSTASVTAVLNGGAPGATIEYQLTGYWGTAEAMLGSGTVANGSAISIPISSTNPPQSVAVAAWATVSGQVVATSSVNVLLALGYSIQLGVTTPSSYSDGSYQPGQTVTLSYQVVATGGAALPRVMTFDLLAIGYPFFNLIQNVGPSGSIPFTIPSNAVQGSLLVELVATGVLTGGPCLPGNLCTGVLALSINPNPSVLTLEIGAGSGITVGWLVLLILVIVVAVVLYLALRRRGGMRRATLPTSSTTSTMGPPASAPTTPPPTEWQAPPPPPPTEPTPEPTGGGEAPPPLPQPPAKSQ
ncbi:MAG TPA: hypothetical protein VEJ85_00820 [Thermoplasmata archaeon]|nr:hypothetical protein [Thermoplasmata archaeon]